MTVSYDVSLMRQLVAACQTANDEIVKAQQLILAVKSHADWTCKEKSVIDELMGECKSQINRMQEDQNGFLNVLKQVEGELDGAEKSISHLFHGVDSILSKVLAIPVGQAVAIGGGLIGATPIGGHIENKADQIIAAVSKIGSTIGTGPDVWHGPAMLPGIAGIDLELPTVTDVFDPAVTGAAVAADVASWYENTMAEPIPVCRMSDIQL